MSKTKIELNHSAIRELLQSAAVENACMAQIKRIKSMCGPGYETDTYTGRTRVNASIRPVTAAAKQDNAGNNTLKNVMGSLK